MTEVEHAVAIAIVVDDHAGVGDTRGDVAHHQVGGRQGVEIDGRGHARRDGDIRASAIRNETEAFPAPGRDHSRGLGRFRRQHAERLGQPLQSPHQRGAKLVRHSARVHATRVHVARVHATRVQVARVHGPGQHNGARDQNVNLLQRLDRNIQPHGLATCREHEPGGGNANPGLHGCHSTPSWLVQP